MPIDTNFVRTLCDIGNSEDRTAALLWLEGSGGINRRELEALRDNDWMRLSKSLEPTDLIDLVKALTLIERRGDSWRGSASPVPILFRELARIASWEDVADWVLRHRDNEWMPFGFVIPLDLGSMAEYRAWLSVRAAGVREEKRARLQVNLPKIRLDHERHLLNEALRPGRATQALFNAIRRGDVAAVKALLVKGADVHAKASDGRSVREIAEQKGNREILELLQRPDV